MSHPISAGVLALAIVCACGWLPATEAHSLLLTKDGQPQAVIVLSDKPTSSAQLAAFELQHHLRKISGAAVPIIKEPKDVEGTTIYVGDSRLDLALQPLSQSFCRRRSAAIRLVADSG